MSQSPNGSTSRPQGLAFSYYDPTTRSFADSVDPIAQHVPSNDDQDSSTPNPDNTSTTNNNFVCTIGFFDLPWDIRATIYRYLIGIWIINVNAADHPNLTIRRPGRNNTLVRNGPFPILPTNNSSWLALSRRFLNEAREILWELASFEFERRWDFINAFANQSLAAVTCSVVSKNISMSPPTSTVFTQIQTLHLDLTRKCDFSYTVSIQEAKRVTTTILNILINSMPRLRSLRLQVDDNSRLHGGFIVFLPAAWFLRMLIDVSLSPARAPGQMERIEVVPGGNWVGVGKRREVQELCCRVVNVMLAGHLEAVRVGEIRGWGREREEMRRRRKLLTFGVAVGPGSDVGVGLRVKVGREILRVGEVERPGERCWMFLGELCDRLEGL